MANKFLKKAGLCGKMYRYLIKKAIRVKDGSNVLIQVCLTI